MIAIDTSALVSVIGGGQDADRLMACASCASRIVLSTASGAEAAIVVRAKWGTVGMERLERMIDLLSIEHSAVDEVLMRIAIDAHRRYGRGSGHPARLNYGDCFSYALAKSLDVPLLYKGDDFIHTDIRSAIEP